MGYVRLVGYVTLWRYEIALIQRPKPYNLLIFTALGLVTASYTALYYSVSSEAM